MYKIGDKFKRIEKHFAYIKSDLYEIAMIRESDKKFIIFDDNNKARAYDKKLLEENFTLVEKVINMSLKNGIDSVNNGGSTDYYKFKENWKECQDIIEDRELNFSQGNIFKSAFCFNIGRHNATDYQRELNKIIYFSNRELERIKNASR